MICRGRDPATKLLRALLRAVAALCLACLPLAAQASAPNGPAAELTACVSPVRPGDSAAALWRDAARFDCTTPQSAFGPGSYWVRIVLPAAQWQALDGPALLTFMPAWQQDARLYIHRGDGTFGQERLDNVSLSRFGRIGAHVAIPLAGSAARPDGVLLRIDGAINASGLLQVPRLQSERQADRQHLTEAVVYAAFAGVAIALLAYNLLMWLAMRERFQVFYCLTLAAMLAYAFSHSGALDMAFPQLGAEMRFRFSYFALAGIAASAVAFLIDCIEPGILSRRLRRYGHAACWLVLLTGLAVMVAPDPWAHTADRFYVASFVPIPAIAVLLAAQAWRRGSRIVRLLVLAWSFPLGMALVRIAHAGNLIGYSLWVEHSAIVALGIEALLSALAMSFRIKRIARERDEARAEERVARRLADIDPLTGLLNRRALLAGVLGWGSDEELRLVLVDIDHFKAINDRAGHDTGDEVLREVATVLAATAEIRATVARLGGEEFALFGPASELDDALALALLGAVRGHQMPEGLRVTVSAGSACGRIGCEADWRELYRRADQALYRAKQGGRDRLELAAPAPARAAAA